MLSVALLAHVGLAHRAVVPLVIQHPAAVSEGVGRNFAFVPISVAI